MDPHLPRLRLHSLYGDLGGLQAVWITYEYRLVVELDEEAGEIILVDIGSHDQVYGPS